jgi:hypothetical protein
MFKIFWCCQSIKENTLEQRLSIISSRDMHMCDKLSSQQIKQKSKKLFTNSVALKHLMTYRLQAIIMKKRPEISSGLFV